MHLQTNQLIRRQFVTSIPITKAVINQVHELAERDKMPHGLKITHKEGQLLFDNALFAGVDDNKNGQSDDEEYEPEDSIKLMISMTTSTTKWIKTKSAHREQKEQK